MFHPTWEDIETEGQRKITFWVRGTLPTEGKKLIPSFVRAFMRDQGVKAKSVKLQNNHLVITVGLGQYPVPAGTGLPAHSGQASNRIPVPEATTTEAPQYTSPEGGVLLP